MIWKMCSLIFIRKLQVMIVGKGIWTIMKKELARFFKDGRMCLTTLLLPGLMIYILYSFMGDALGSQLNVADDFQPRIRTVELSDSMKELFAQAGLQPEEIGTEEEADALNAIQQEELDLLIIFPENFDAAVAAYDASQGDDAPNVEIYYNSASTDSSTAFEQVQGLLDQYESSLTNLFDINRGQEGYDLADDRDLAGMTMSSMMPLLILVFLFSGCMAIAPESIAGEKERGTIATILVTPIRRSELALGKIFSLSIIALLSGLSSTVGILLSMPKLMGGMEVNMNVYGAADYVMLGLVILSTVLFLIALISIISAFAKTIKEAQTLVLPLMMIAMVVGVTSMFGSAQSETVMYLIPLYSSVQCMSGIFSFDFSLVNMSVCVISNLLYTVVLIFVLTRMFHSERIIFTK